MQAPAIISNTFILHLRPGEKTICEFGGIGKFMNFKGINVTDSGGFQMYSPSLYIKSNVTILPELIPLSTRNLSIYNLKFLKSEL